MKVLYALNGVGNGHVSRAREILPQLKELADVDVAISGSSPEVKLPIAPKFAMHGIGYTVGTGGGIDYRRTFEELKMPKFFRDVRNFPVEEYDLVINDYEPVTARSAQRAGVPVVGLSHQASFLSPETPRPEARNTFYEFILRKYAPCPQNIGFHFARYDDFIRTPVIRSEVRQLNPTDLGHYTVYLPAYGDEVLCKLFGQVPDVEWEVFSKHAKRTESVRNVTLRPIENGAYLRSLETCRGLLTGGGFEAPAEALFLGKNLMVVPLRGQYEQLCNAAAAGEMGVPVLAAITNKTIEAVADWARHAQPLSVNFPDETRSILEEIIRKHEPTSKARKTAQAA